MGVNQSSSVKMADETEDEQEDGSKRRRQTDGRCREALRIDDEESEGEEEEEDQYALLHERFVRGTQSNFAALQERAGAWKKGRWSASELRRLKRNIRAFKREHHIGDIQAFVFGAGTRKGSQFFTYISRGIKRPVSAVYDKAKLSLNTENYVGFWSRRQERKLLRLYSVYGKRWALLGRRLGMTATAVNDKYRRLIHSKNRGEWSEGEQRRLREAVLGDGEGVGSDGEGVRGVGDGELPSHLSWEVVADRVGTRNAIQCRMKWVLCLSWRRGGVASWTATDNGRLLQSLATLDAEDEEEVEWAGLAEAWPSTTNGYFLRRKWSMLRRDVPGYCLKSFQENLDYLLQVKAPPLQPTDS